VTARNGAAGYGWASKLLHWLTVVVIGAQFAVGVTMDAGDSGRGRGRGRGGESGRGRGRGGEESYLDDPETLLRLHVVLGLSILLLAVGRVAWRRIAGLPPWSDHLSERQRRRAHWTERALLASLFAIPGTGLVLVGVGDDSVLPLHLAAHAVFLVALAAHLTTNLRPVILRRML
jgi:cytochrome b561